LDRLDLARVLADRVDPRVELKAVSSSVAQQAGSATQRDLRAALLPHSDADSWWVSSISDLPGTEIPDFED
jgi:hypothetical protein